MLFPLYNGKLKLEHTFSLPTFVNMLLSQLRESFAPYEETESDDGRRLRKSQQSQKTRRTFEQTYVYAKARTRSRSKLFKRQMDSQHEESVCYLSLYRVDVTTASRCITCHNKYVKQIISPEHRFYA